MTVLYKGEFYMGFADYLRKKSNLSFTIGGVTLVILVGVFDYITGPEFILSVFYLLPISAVTWFVGTRAGIFLSFASVAVWLAADSTLASHYTSTIAPYWNGTMRLSSFLIVTWLLGQLRQMNSTLEHRVEEKTAALVADISTRLRIEEQLRKMANAIESAADTFVITDKDGVIEYVNPAFEKLTGYSKEEAVGKTPRILKSGQHDRAYYERLWESLLAGEVFHTVFLNMKKTSELYSQEVTITPVRDDKGNVVSFVSTGRDITERKRAEEGLRLFRTLIDQTNEAIEVVDPETGRFLDVNERACLDLGYTREELLSLSVFDINPMVDKDAFKHTQEQLRTSRSLMWQGVHLRKDGSTFPVEVSLRYVQLDRGYMVAVVRDMAERVKAEEALKESQKQYKDLVDNALIGVYQTTLSGEILFVNDALAKMFEFDSAEEIKSTSVISRYKNPKDRAHMMAELTKTGNLVNFELEVLTKAGQTRNVLLAATLRDGRISGMMKDVTEMKKLEKKWIQAQKMESIGTLASGIAHDFNNILGIILGHASILEGSRDNPAAFFAGVETIMKAVHRGAGLVQQILTFARRGDVSLESVAVNDSVKELSKMLEGTFPKVIEIRIQLGRDIRVVNIDPGQLHQALLNLCVNARDAMMDPQHARSGGSLSIGTHLVRGSEVRSRFADAKDSDYVCITVTDNGPGMDEATVQRVFEPFFTTKGPGKGTGLGLAVVYGVVQNHNGFVDVESKIGAGTSFRIYLPVGTRNIGKAGHHVVTEGEVPGGTETILLVEDEESFLDLMKLLLEKKGYTVLTAKDGVEAVRTYSQKMDQIGLVMMDMGLPKLDGAAVFAALKDINPDVVVVITSGYVEPSLRSELFKAGVREFIQKPYAPSEALRKIQDVIEGANGGSPSRSIFPQSLMNLPHKQSEFSGSLT